MNKVSLATNLIMSLRKKAEKLTWHNLKKIDIDSSSIFSEDESGVFFSDGYITFGTDSSFMAIGKYEDRYYYDEDKYSSEFDYFFSFGKKEKDTQEDDIYSTNTVRRGELLNFQAMNAVSEIYDTIVLKSTDINNADDFMEKFLD